MDIIGSILLLVLLFPLVIIIIPLSSSVFNGKPLFQQKRVGQAGKPFFIFKFRTIPISDKHASSYGSFLRRYSLDEIPQLINVLRGDMSLIGPRPLYPEYLKHYNEYHAQRHKVRPGITGLAQIQGRNDLDWSSRFDKDVEYIQRLSFKMDAKILIKTIRAVLSAKGADGHKSVEPFTGYN